MRVVQTFVEVNHMDMADLCACVRVDEKENVRKKSLTALWKEIQEMLPGRDPKVHILLYSCFTIMCIKSNFIRLSFSISTNYVRLCV